MTNGDAFRAGLFTGAKMRKSDEQLARILRYDCPYCIQKEPCDGSQCEERQNHIDFMTMEYKEAR